MCVSPHNPSPTLQCFPCYKDCDSLVTQIHMGFLPFWFGCAGAEHVARGFPCRLVCTCQDTMLRSVSIKSLLDAGWALCGHETPAGQAQGDPKGNMQGKSRAQEAPHRPASPQKPDTTCTEGMPAATRPAADNCSSSTADSAEPCPAFVQLSRDDRIVLGQKCKQLIDAGRKDWLLQQGFQARALVLPIFDAHL